MVWARPVSWQGVVWQPAGQLQVSPTPGTSDHASELTISLIVRNDLVHAVLVVEQLLTTGGGWQDQVGGLHSDLTLGRSDPGHNVTVVSTPANVSSSFIEQLDSRLLLLFTGKPRLAKNLLQNVIR